MRNRYRSPTPRKNYPVAFRLSCYAATMAKLVKENGETYVEENDGMREHFADRTNPDGTMEIEGHVMRGVAGGGEAVGVKCDRCDLAPKQNDPMRPCPVPLST